MDSLPKIAKSEDLAMVCHQVAERAARILSDFAKRCPQPGAASDELGIAKAYMDLYARMLADPMALGTHAMNMWLDYAQLWQSNWMKMLGQDVTPIAIPDPGDARFKDDAWANNFLFDFIKQSYLIASRHMQHAVSDVDGLSDESQKKVAFFTRMYAEALSPSNFVMTNPQVLRETLSTGGENLLRGLNNLLGDIEKGEGQLRISMTDEN
jgi:polyhydroxyalkanoate synthase subunit PhaC